MDTRDTQNPHIICFGMSHFSSPIACFFFDPYDPLVPTDEFIVYPPQTPEDNYLDCKVDTFILPFGCLAGFRSVVWPDSIRLFGCAINDPGVRLASPMEACSRQPSPRQYASSAGQLPEVRQRYFALPYC